jgi:hypothetical protein
MNDGMSAIGHGFDIAKCPLMTFGGHCTLWPGGHWNSFGAEIL